MSPLLMEKARALGFVAIGFSRPQRPPFFDCYLAWIEAGRHGDMHWLNRYLDLRENPAKLFEGCRTVISLGYPYGGERPATPDGFTAARYTEPRKDDYHNRLRSLCRNLARDIQERHPNSRVRICVDSAPIMERSLAQISGIGFIGKNNMLIVPGHGSYLFLAEILTTALIEFPESVPFEDLCGSCTRCGDACPTGALEAPHSLNASRCLSYLTIECRDRLSRETGKQMGHCFFGCDVCQEVCPFNEGKCSEDLSLPPTNDFLNMKDEKFKDRFGKTAFNRAGLEKLKENIRAVRARQGGDFFESLNTF